MENEGVHTKARTEATEMERRGEDPCVPATKAAKAKCHFTDRVTLDSQFQK